MRWDCIASEANNKYSGANNNWRRQKDQERTEKLKKQKRKKKLCVYHVRLQLFVWIRIRKVPLQSFNHWLLNHNRDNPSCSSALFISILDAFLLTVLLCWDVQFVPPRPWSISRDDLASALLQQDDFFLLIQIQTSSSLVFLSSSDFDTTDQKEEREHITTISDLKIRLRFAPSCFRLQLPLLQVHQIIPLD